MNEMMIRLEVEEEGRARRRFAVPRAEPRERAAKRVDASWPPLLPVASR